MVTGDHVEVSRSFAPGERQRYTKRFSTAGDFRDWTEREWRSWRRRPRHRPCPMSQFDRGAADRPALVQTYDAGITVDHWATLLPVRRDGPAAPCSKTRALVGPGAPLPDRAQRIHELQIVHLDPKADNVCIPFDPTDFNPRALANC